MLGHLIIYKEIQILIIMLLVKLENLKLVEKSEYGLNAYDIRLFSIYLDLKSSLFLSLSFMTWFYNAETGQSKKCSILYNSKS